MLNFQKDLLLMLTAPTVMSVLMSYGLFFFGMAARKFLQKAFVQKKSKEVALLTIPRISENEIIFRWMN